MKEVGFSNCLETYRNTQILWVGTESNCFLGYFRFQTKPEMFSIALYWTAYIVHELEEQSR